MNRQTTRRVAVTLVTVAALGLVPIAGAAQAAQPQTWCPDGLPCDTGVRPDPVRSAKPKIVPRAATGPNGQQVYRSGRWLME